MIICHRALAFVFLAILLSPPGLYVHLCVFMCRLLVEPLFTGPNKHSQINAVTTISNRIRQIQREVQQRIYARNQSLRIVAFRVGILTPTNMYVGVCICILGSEKVMATSAR